MAVGNSMIRIALAATLAVLSLIVMGLSAKLVHDGKIYNDYLKRYAAIQNSRNTNTFNTGSSFTFKRDQIINTGFGQSYIFFDAPVPAYAVDLTFSLLSLFASVAIVILAVLGTGFPALIALILDGFITVLWLVALAYSGQAFSHAGLFKSTVLDGLSVTQIPKAAFAFIVLSFLVSLALLVFSILAFVGRNKATADAPQPPLADAPVAHDNTVPPAHQEHFGMPQEQEKQQPAMNVPV